MGLASRVEAGFLGPPLAYALASSKVGLQSRSGIAVATVAAGTKGEEADQVHVDLEKVGHVKPGGRVLRRSSSSLLMYLEAPRTERCFSRTAMHLPCMHLTLVYLASQRWPIAHSQPGERLISNMSCPYGSAILSAEATSSSLVCYRIKSLSKMLRRWCCVRGCRFPFGSREPYHVQRGAFPFYRHCATSRPSREETTTRLICAFRSFLCTVKVRRHRYAFAVLEALFTKGLWAMASKYPALPRFRIVTRTRWGKKITRLHVTSAFSNHV